MEDGLPPLPENYAAALKLIDEAHAQDPTKIKVPTGNRHGSSDDGNGSGARVGEEMEEVPYELHYARQMTRWLALRCRSPSPPPSPALQLACRAQHFRRWELARAAYPPGRAGYLTWRARQKAQAAAQVAALLARAEPAIPREEAERVAALVRKEGLGRGGGGGGGEATAAAAEGAGEGGETETETETEVQILEDAACLVFLAEQLDAFVFGQLPGAEAGAGAGAGAGPDVDEAKAAAVLRKTWAKMSPEGRRLALGAEMQGALTPRARSLVAQALEL